MNATPLARPIAIARQLSGPNPLEYVVLFLVVVAGVLTLAR
jgi:hypothetical protein